RCAEEPATRWEGLYELSNSKYQAAANEAEAREAAIAQEKDGAEKGEAAEGEAEHASLNHGEAGAEGATAEEAEAGEGEAADTDPRVAKLFSTRESYYTPDPELIGLLTAEQKRRLADVLFNVKQVTEDELTLIELVKEWDDPRFVPFALAQLRGFGDEPPYIAETLMTALAERLNNNELARLAATCAAKNAYFDEDVEDVEEAVAAANEEEKVEEDPVEKAFEESLTGNSAQKRKLRLQRFIAHAEVALAN
ncbi:MAG TPA: hypothetical protein VJT74_08635, partial [Pyrinomonadaceae bacterium]|nr:hypothetical protein [Pyrinomonadaceae bacterium]